MILVMVHLALPRVQEGLGMDVTKGKESKEVWNKMEREGRRPWK